MGEKAVAVVASDGMQCGDHPYRTNPGGICAFCLQEKLGKLVNASKSSTSFYPIFPPHRSSPSSYSSPLSLHSSPSVANASTTNVISSAHKPHWSIRPGILFFYGTDGHMKRKKKKATTNVGSTVAATSKASSTTATTTSSCSSGGGGFVFRRSKSVAPRVVASFPEGDLNNAGDTVVESPRRRWLWSFLHSSSDPTKGGGRSRGRKHKHQQHQGSKVSEIPSSITITNTKEDSDTNAIKRDHVVVALENTDSPSESQTTSSSGRNVARSRSLGCGSRSFSGDFLERISTGLGDCALRRVESLREPKKMMEDGDSKQQPSQRVRCGGIFGGLGNMSLSSYWLPVELGGCAGRICTPADDGGSPHSRAKGWEWHFASPMRAFRRHQQCKQ